MLRELTEALDAFTAERPLVLVLEDLHWSDRASLEWLAYVARRPDPARLLILGTYRPMEAIVQVHPLRAVLTELRQHGECVEVALDYLSEAEVAVYLCQRFGDTRLAADLAHVLHRRITGNSLFLIALVDELVRQQVVREGPEGWDVRGGVETITAIIPAHLRALIELQLAHLSMEQAMALERVDLQAFCRLAFGEAQLLASHLEEAQALAACALAHAREHQERGNQAYALRLLGDIAAQRDPSESALAEAQYRQALTLADELGMRPLKAHCHLGLGTLYVKTAQREQARAELSAAIELYRAMEMTFWLPQSEAAMASLSSGAG